MEDKIKKFILTEIVKDSSCKDIDPYASLIENGIIDSLGIQKLIVFIEDNFSIDIADDDLIPDNFESLRAITVFLNSKSG